MTKFNVLALKASDPLLCVCVCFLTVMDGQQFYFYVLSFSSLVFK